MCNAVKICVLASGSEGNSTYIETSSHKILIDLGMNMKYIKMKLEELDVSPNEIDTVLISHVHNDHIGCLENFIKKYNPILYMTRIMIDELPSEMRPSLEDMAISQEDLLKYFKTMSLFEIK